MRLVLQLVLALLVGWVVSAYPTWLGGGDRAVGQSAAAAGLCLLPAVATLLWGQWALRQAPEHVLLLIVGGMGLRLLVVFGGGVALAGAGPFFRGTAFWLWVGVFYVCTLALETGLLLWGCQRSVSTTGGAQASHVGGSALRSEGSS